MELKVNETDLLAVKTMFAGVKGAYKRVVMRSINKTLTNTRVFAVKEIGKDLNLTPARIKLDFHEDRAFMTRIRGRLFSTGGPISLTTYRGTRQLKAGVKIRVHKSKSATLLKHAFIESKGSGSGAPQVFWRRWEGTRAKIRPGFSYARLPQRYKYPLERLTGPRIEDEYSKDKVINPVMKYAGERFVINLDAQVKYELSKL